MQTSELTAAIKARAAELGFDLCGIASAGPIARASYLRDWLATGRAGTMGYLHRHVESRTDVRAWLPWARSVIVAALNYHQPAPQTDEQQPRGRVAMYAWGRDYHVVLRRKLETLLNAIRDLHPTPFESRICVNTSAIVERELAAAAGIGWIGKNTLVLNSEIGSFFFLGEIVTSLELPPDPPQSDHCGSCTRCLDACPTNAFPTPYVMDARRCISYLTIEHRGDIEPDLADKMGDWVFGCDVCQTVCPYNREAPTTREPAFAANPEWARPPLSKLLAEDDTAARARTAGTAQSRAKPAMWKRNAAIALRNSSTSP